MTALEFIADLIARGVVFYVADGRLRVRDREMATTPGERGLISALKPTIRALIVMELPAARTDAPCIAFTAAPGVAICRDCAHNLPAHYWRTPDCEFFVGEASANTSCRRCGIPWHEHFPALKGTNAP